MKRRPTPPEADEQSRYRKIYPTMYKGEDQ